MMKRDLLTPTLVIAAIVVAILFAWAVVANAQTHTFPGNNVFPSTSTTDFNAGATVDFTGATVTGLAGGGAVTSVFTRTGAVVAASGDYSAFYQPLDTDLTTWAGLTPSANFQTMVPHTFAQMKTDLGLVIGTNVEAWDTDLDVWATKTPYAGAVTVTTGKTFNCTGNLTLSGTDGSTLNMGGGGTLGTAAYTASTAYEVPLTFSTGLTRTTNTVTVNTSQNIATLSNLTTNGFVKTGGAVGTLSVDTATYQASSANLTTWAGIAPGTNVGTFLATPSSANLRGALTDENGTGAALFSGATTPDFTTGFTIGAAAASGKIIQGNGTNFGASTSTWPTSGNTNSILQYNGTNFVTSTATWPTTGSTGQLVYFNGTNFQMSGPTFPTSASSNGVIIQSNGTNFVTTSFTWPTAAGTAGKHVESDGTNLVMSTPTYPTAAGAAGYTMRSNATNFLSYPAQLVNSSVTSQSPSTSDVYLAGSNIVVTAGDFKATGQYKCVFDMTKSAGTGAIVITLRVGTAGTTSDAAIQTYTFGAGTSVADTGIFEVIATWRTVGSGTSAVMQGICRGTHQLATTGLFNNAAGWVLIGSPSPSAGFASNTATNIGLSFNGSTAFAGTATLVQAQLQQ